MPEKIPSDDRIGYGKGDDKVKKYSKRPGENLPGHYDKSRLMLMVVDPYWLHVYWLIPKSDIESFKSLVGVSVFERSRFVLRVYDITNIQFNGENAHSYFDINIDLSSKRWYFNVGAPDREYITELGIVTPEGRFIVFLRSNSVHAPRDTISNVIDEQWMSVDVDYNKIFKLSGGGSIGSGSEDIREAIMRRFISDVSSHVFFSGTSEAITAGEKSEKKGDFWLKVETELIVYGATEPDAKVTVCGMPIKLNPDGRFSLRFALPDGEYDIPVEAHSADNKFHKSITPFVKRETK